MEPTDLAPRPETAADIRLEMDATRQRLSDAVAELDARVHDGVEQVKGPVVALRERASGVAARVDVAGFIREKPLAAAAIALGAGLLLAATGADRAAASGTAAGARGAGRAAKGAARSAREAARRKLDERRDERAAEAAAEQAYGGLSPEDERARPAAGAPGLARRLGARLEAQLAEAIESMRESAARLTDGVVAARAARLEEDDARRHSGRRPEAPPVAL